MTVDIGHALRLALSSSGDSGISRQVLSRIPTHVANAGIDWDEGAGEHWARVLVEGHAVAFVFMRAPLAFVLGGVHDVLAQDLELAGCLTVRVDTLDGEVLCSDRDAVVQLAGRAISAHFRHEQFSAEASVITPKPAKDRHLKTGQRELATQDTFPLRLDLAG